jgi:hypothetical protein
LEGFELLGFWWESQMERAYLEDLDVGDRMDLRMRWYGLDYSVSG